MVLVRIKSVEAIQLFMSKNLEVDSHIYTLPCIVDCSSLVKNKNLGFPKLAIILSHLSYTFCNYCCMNDKQKVSADFYFVFR